MNRNAGKLQIKAYNFCQQLNPLLEETKRLIEQGEQLLTENIEEMFSYGGVLVQAVKAFGYECFYKEADWLISINETYEQGILDISNGTLEKMLDVMLRIIDAVVKEKKGKLNRCSCCGSEVYYLPLSLYDKKQMKKYGRELMNETLNKEEYFCPCCNARDRDRFIVEFLKKLEIDKEYHKESLLQIALAKPIEKWIHGNAPALIYHSADSHMQDATFVSDVQDMHHLKDESYDYIICPYVFECIRDDWNAMRELYRIIKEDGVVLFLDAVTFRITAIAEEVGFCVHQLGKQYFGEEVFANCGLTDAATLYVLTREKGEITDLVERKKNKRKKLAKPNPLVSVLMSAYNHEKYVSAAVDSVLNQTYRNYEFLVADDASNDKTVQELVKYEDRIDEIHLFDENAVGRLIFLVGRAKGKYIAIMNSDDIWEKDKLQMQVEYMENHPGCAACFTGAVGIDENSGSVAYDLFLQTNMTKEHWLHHLYVNGNCLVHPSILVKREVYCDLLYSGVSIFRQLPDFWMWTRLLQKHDIHIIERSLVRFLFHDKGGDANTSAKTPENTLRLWWEGNYLWYDIIKNMEDEYFRKVFLDDMKNKDAVSREEICCEKFFVLKEKSSHTSVAAVFYLYDIGQDLEVVQTFREKYGITYRELHKVCNEAGFRKC